MLLDERDPTHLLALQAVTNLAAKIDEERAKRQAQYIIATLAEAMK
jgi:hypothetical protein